MKNLNKLFASLLLVAGLAAQAQDGDNKWAISFGANAVDGARVSAAASVKNQFSQYFDAKKYWNIIPSVSYINVSRYLTNNFSFGVTGSVNKIDKFVDYRTVDANGNSVYNVSNPGDLSYYAVDGVIKYSFQKAIKSKWLDPSAHIGGGYTWFGQASYGTANAGLGLTFWFTRNIGLSLQSTYKHSMEDSAMRGMPDNASRTGIDNVPTHLQHFAGLTFKFGAKDTDGDGIYDKDDACPDVAGLKQFNGCPDTDGDGIEDSKDACPTEAGTPEMNGCPDRDGDGIADNVDACIDVFGLKSLQGCPDKDGDGVADKDDKCVDVKGPKENEGCPWPDTDGDGILDKNDACPTVKGVATSDPKTNGCPKVAPPTEETMKKLNDYGKTILFDTNKYSFQKQTYAVLDAMTVILKEYPDSNFSIDGYTDSDGSDALNLKLSQERAAAVKNYLVEHGINGSRLVSEGFGETKPVASNKTKAGKAQNRRVEVRLMN